MWADRRTRTLSPMVRCPVCARVAGVTQQEVLWPALIESWRLDDHEAALINRQQGERCCRCAASLRSRALASSVSRTLKSKQPLKYLPVLRPWVRILEMNAAGELHPWLKRFPRHTFAEYPTVDMMQLP